jgi:formylglycine-generating enzyme required for sulfatase activity
MKPIQTFLLATGLLAASAASASIVIQTSFVGDAGNANDTTGYGGVSYGYHIGTYEVTNSQYTAFLNAVAATDTHSLYDPDMGTWRGGINRTGSSGSYTYSVKTGFDNKPVNYVSFWDAARFANWLTNGDTETGVYNLNGTTNPTNNTITRDATAWANGGVAVASENEWYKAAYYDGNGSYYDYPTQNDSAPTDIAPGDATGSNNANYNSAVGSFTDVGAYSNSASYYGTFDQGGNVWEYNDTIVGSSVRGMRGGAFNGSDNDLQSSYRIFSDPSTAPSYTGFRVSSLAPIPEPSAYAAILGCLGLGLALMRRKGRGTL